MNTAEKTMLSNVSQYGTNRSFARPFPALAIQGAPRPNHLLYSMIVVSFLLHGLLLYNSDIFRTKETSYIELTMEYVPKKVAHDPPPPSPHKLVAPKNIEEIPTESPKKTQKKKQIRPVAKAATKSDPLKQPQPPAKKVQPIVRPTPAPPMVTPVHQTVAAAPQKNTVPDRKAEQLAYLTLIQQRIEQHKQYPLMARRHQIEGRVGVRFSISPSGHIKNIEISHSSKQEILDRNALKAVRNAAPFPAPPTGLFLQAPPIELFIVFKLT